LCPTNRAVDAINDGILERLPGDARTLVGRTVLRDDPYDNANPFAAPELLDALHHSGVPPTTLRLKVGALCMTVRNLSSENALMNATRVVSTPARKCHRKFTLSHTLAVRISIFRTCISSISVAVMLAIKL